MKVWISPEYFFGKTMMAARVSASTGVAVISNRLPVMASSSFFISSRTSLVFLLDKEDRDFKTFEGRQLLLHRLDDIEDFCVPV